MMWWRLLIGVVLGLLIIWPVMVGLLRRLAGPSTEVSAPSA